MTAAIHVSHLSIPRPSMSSVVCYDLGFGCKQVPVHVLSQQKIQLV